MKFIRLLVCLTLTLCLLTFVGCNTDDFSQETYPATMGEQDFENNDYFKESNRKTETQAPAQNSNENTPATSTVNAGNNKPSIPTITENNPEDAIRDTFTVIFGGLKALSSEKIKNIAPDAFWTYYAKQYSDLPMSLMIDEYADLMEDRERVYDTYKDNQYEKYSFDGAPTPMVYFQFYDNHLVYSYPSYDLKDLSEELNQKYGISESTVKEAKVIQLNRLTWFDYEKTVNNYFKFKITSSLYDIKIITVLIGNRWYVYDRGMFYPELMYAVLTAGNGFNYLMGTEWLKIENQLPDMTQPENNQPGSNTGASKPTNPSGGNSSDDCSRCAGTGSCSYCGFGECDQCFGDGSTSCSANCFSGRCTSCAGDGGYYSYSGFDAVWRKCSRCNGSGFCRSCDGLGTRLCSRCGGNGKCAYCFGSLHCSYCYDTSKK